MISRKQFHKYVRERREQFGYGEIEIVDEFYDMISNLKAHLKAANRENEKLKARLLKFTTPKTKVLPTTAKGEE